ncbi:hypothetical protein [Azospirillum argentinense]
MITFDDPDFVALTGCDGWKERLDGGVAKGQGAACAATQAVGTDRAMDIMMDANSPAQAGDVVQ